MVSKENHLGSTPHPFAADEVLRLWAQDSNMMKQSYRVRARQEDIRTMERNTTRFLVPRNETGAVSRHAE
jgi:hypothetical protein